MNTINSLISRICQTLIGVILLLEAFASAYAQTYTYDMDGRLVRATYSNGSKVNYGYDGAGNIFSISTNAVSADTNRPVVNIVSPSTGSTVSNAFLSLTGTASDNVQVASVFFQLNTSAWVLAASANSWANWSATNVTLLPGTNTLKAYAVDTSGNKSLTNSVSFVYILSAVLTVHTNGSGTVNPNYNGALLQIGANYSMTATASAGFGFTGWTGSSTTNGATLKFLMASNLTFTANFVDTTKPTVTITSPTSGQHMTNALATVKGTASDNWKVTGVWYQLNSGPWNQPTTTNSYTNWTTTLTLVAGTNTVRAYAMDLGGNFSTTNSLSVVSSNTFKLQLAFTNALPLKTNGLVFSLQLSTGLNGLIQVSTNLTSWVTLTNFVGTNSTLIFRDAAATNSSRRFYRAVIP